MGALIARHLAGSGSKTATPPTNLSSPHLGIAGCSVRMESLSMGAAALHDGEGRTEPTRANEPNAGVSVVIQPG